MNGVQSDERINLLQQALLPMFKFGNDLVGDVADSGRRDAESMQVFNFPVNGGVTHTEREQTDNLILNLIRQGGGMLLSDELRLESAVAVTWLGQFKRTGGDFEGFLGGAIFSICFNSLSQMAAEFSGQRLNRLECFFEI